jgi:drug/metabolite transporter (DMT)-like permease
MPIKDLAITIAAILLGSVGQLMIKMGLVACTARYGSIDMASIWGKIPCIIRTPYIIAATLLFLLSAAFWMVVMSKRDLSQIYPFIGLSYFFVSLLAYYFLKEHIGAWRIAGILIIITGVIVLAQDKVTTVIN